MKIRRPGIRKQHTDGRFSSCAKVIESDDLFVSQVQAKGEDGEVVQPTQATYFHLTLSWEGELVLDTFHLPLIVGLTRSLYS